MTVRLVNLSQSPAVLPDAVALVEEYLRLPDAWNGAPPEELPDELRSELAEFPGNAVPPAGEVTVAYDGSDPVAVALLRPLTASIVEIKRLYVRPTARRAGFGRATVEVLIELSRSLGYQQVVLDAMSSREPAIRLYRAMGFVPIEPYRTYTWFKAPLTAFRLDLGDSLTRAPEPAFRRTRHGTVRIMSKMALAQRVAVLIGLGCTEFLVGRIVTLDVTSTGWVAYAPLSNVINPPWPQELWSGLIWFGLIVIWTGAAVWMLRNRNQN